MNSSDSTIVYKEELALFHKLAKNVGIDKIQWVEYRPTSQLSDFAPLEFNIPGNGMQYIDMKRTRLYVKAKIVQPDGSALPLYDPDTAVGLSTPAKVGPINLLLHSMFRQVDVSLQQRHLSSGCNYPYKSMMDVLLGYGADAKSTQLQSHLFERDEDTMDAADPANGENVGLTRRSEGFIGSKEVSMEGPLFVDMMCTQQRYILNGVALSIRLWPSKNTFRLMRAVQENDGAEHKLKITDASLRVCLVTVSPEVIMGHNETLKKTPAIYPYMRSEVKTYTIPEKHQQMTLDDLYQGQIPVRVVIGFVSAAAYNGHFQKNPFNFQPFRLSFLGTFVDGESCPARPLEGKDAMSYLNLFAGMHTLGKDRGNGIRKEAFENGHALYVFDLDPISENKSHWPSARTGQFRIEARFAKGLDEAVTAVVYASFPAEFGVDHSRAIVY